jgi:hypothetical protein
MTDREATADSEPISLTLENLPRPQDFFSTSKLCLTWHHHFYNSSPSIKSGLNSTRPLASIRRGVAPEGADVGPVEVASTTNQADGAVGL